MDAGEAPLRARMGVCQQGPGATGVREELLERTHAGLGFDYASVADELDGLARDLVRAEDYERAAGCLGEILRIRLATLGAEDPATLATMLSGLRVAIELERWDEVETLARECYEAHVRVLGAADSNTEKCLRVIVEAHEKQGDEVQAETWRAKLQGAGG